MTDKEQIEEIEKVLQDEQIKIANTVEEFAKLQQVGINKCNAEALYNIGYRKVSEDEIVISKKEYNRLKGVYDTEKELLSQLSKEGDRK